MAENAKMSILYLLEILWKETDPEHMLNANDLIDKLAEQHGMVCSRKTIYSDISRLTEFGIDIRQIKGSNPGYYIGERSFELAELKLLVDAVQSSKFITADKTASFIKKLEGLTSEHDAKYLNRQIYIYNRAKTVNETIYTNVDVIHQAISDNLQISFRYCEWTLKKVLTPKKNGAIYTVSPWALVWDDENYYMVAYDEEAGKIKHYRVDKIQDMEITNISRVGRRSFEDFDLGIFSKKTFGMYGGEDTRVTLRCRNNLVGVIIDRFGRDVMLIPSGDEHFRTTVLVSVSKQFFGWVTGIGEDIEIAGPPEVRAEYSKYIQEIRDKYKE